MLSMFCWAWRMLSPCGAPHHVCTDRGMARPFWGHAAHVGQCTTMISDFLNFFYTSKYKQTGSNQLPEVQHLASESLTVSRGHVAGAGATQGRSSCFWLRHRRKMCHRWYSPARPGSISTTHWCLPHPVPMCASAQWVDEAWHWHIALAMWASKCCSSSGTETYMVRGPPHMVAHLVAVFCSKWS